MPVFKIHHVTKYQYDSLVKESINEIRIYPYQCPEQESLQHQLIITGSPAVFTFSDYWGNTVGSFNLMAPHRELVIESKLLVRTVSSDEPALNGSGGFTELEQEIDSRLNMLELASADHIEAANAIAGIVATIHDPAKPIAAVVKESCDYIYQNFQYVKGITSIETTVDEILELKSGVCQDFAHVLLQLLRTMKIPSRYVSGYICPNKNGMRGEGATHAWVEAWIPGPGWTGIDPTNNVWVTNKHVKLAVGRSFKDCTPIKGSFRGTADQNLSVHVSVGYEDGKTFEDINNVRLDKSEKKRPAPVQEQPQQ
jgi:transglutaminase-like putative cysteine protease